MRSISVGILVFEIANEKGFEGVVSAHVQLPLKTANLLKNANVKTYILTNRFKEDRTLPAMLDPEIEIVFISDPMKRGDRPVMHSGPSKNVNAYSVLSLIIEIVIFCKRKNINVLHLFGSEKLGYLAGLLKFFMRKTKIVWTCNTGEFSSNKSLIKNFILSNVDCFITSTNYMLNQARYLRCKKLVATHGVIRTFKVNRNSGSLDTVLFWRDPSYENGADLCVEAFRMLAPRFPEINFILAVRPHWNMVKEMNEIEESLTNIKVYKFPYPGQVTLDDLLSRAIVCVFPFRKLSTNPQWAILESIISGVPVIASNVGSNNEIIDNGSDLLNYHDLDELVRLINKHIEKNTGKQHAYSSTVKLQKWNWDNYLEKILSAYWTKWEEAKDRPAENN